MSIRNKFLSRFDAKVPGVYPKAEVMEEKRAQIRNLVHRDR